MKKWVGLLISIYTLLFINIKTVSANITVTPQNITMGINDTKRIEISGNINEVRIRNGNSNVVLVEGNIITGLNPGTAYITITDEISTTSCKVTVLENYIPVNSLSLSKTNEILTLNATSQIKVNISPENASNKEVNYISNNPSIASVTSKGIVTANKVGKTYISVSVDNKTQIYNVTVIDTIALKSISIPSTLTIQEGNISKLNVTYNPSNATNKKVTWKSSNTKIVTVDSSGNIKGISAGSASITATSNDGNHVSKSTIVVTKADKSLKNIFLNKAELNMKIGDEITLTVTFDPTNAENKKVTWKSSNNNVATVDNSGKITAIGSGNTEIIVKADEGEKEAKCIINVTSEPIKSISFSDEEITIYENSKVTLKTISNPENTAINNPIWTSSDEEVATVENGIVKAKSIGTTLITVSNDTKDIKASIKVNVIKKEETENNELLINVKGYNLNFDKDKKDYTLLIGNEDSLDITVNLDDSKYTIGGNRDLKNGSIITITIKDRKKTTYVISIKKKQNYTIYFIAFISVLLIANIIRLLKKKKK